MPANGLSKPGTDLATVRVIIATIHVCRVAFDSNAALMTADAMQNGVGSNSVSALTNGMCSRRR
jgi:hypothetical protein